MSHTYPTIVGTGFQVYEVQVRAYDRRIENPADDGSNWYAAAETLIRVSEKPPSVRRISGVGSVAEHGTYTVSFTASGPDVVGLTERVVQWGDGTETTVPAGTNSATHVYATPGEYQIIGYTVSPAGTGTTDNTVIVSVIDVAPAVVATGPGTVARGSGYDLRLSAAGVGPDGLVTWTVNWGDGTTETFGPNDGVEFTVNHAYAYRAAAYPAIRVTATDEVGSYAAFSPAVPVQNVAPVPVARVAVAPDANEAVVGRPMYLPAAEPGSEVVLVLQTDLLYERTVSRYTIDWGDGAVTTVTDIPGAVTYTDDNGTPDDTTDDVSRTATNPTGAATVSHRYAAGARRADQTFGTGGDAYAVQYGLTYTIKATAVASGTTYAVPDQRATVIDPSATAPDAPAVLLRPPAPLALTYSGQSVGTVPVATFVAPGGPIDLNDYSAFIVLPDTGEQVPAAVTYGAAANEYAILADLFDYRDAGTYTTVVALVRGGTAIVGGVEHVTTIARRSLTVRANAVANTYGNARPLTAADITFTGLVAGDTVTGVTLASAGSAAGALVTDAPYAIYVSAATGSGLANYDITYVPGTLTVSPRALTVTAASLTKTYGETVPLDAATQVSVGAGQLVNDDTLTAVALTSGGAAATAGVGTYGLVPSAAGGFGLANDAISYVPGTLVVSPRGLTITAARTKVYGDTVTFAGTEFAADGLVNGDAVSAVTLASDGFAETAPAGGPYQVVASAATGTGLGNYAITYVAGNLTIDRRGLTITARDRTKPFGRVATFAGTEFTSEGLILGDAVAGVTLDSPVAAAAASAATGRGLANYQITYIPGELTVAGPGITVGPAARPRGVAGSADHQPLSAVGGRAGYTFAVTGGRLPTGLRLEGGFLMGVPTEAGSLSVAITATDADGFAGSKVFGLSIALPTVTVTSTTLPAGAVGVDYSRQLAAAGGVGGHTFRLAAGGSLPAGLSLVDGRVTGRPTVGGVYSFEVIASDNTTGNGPVASRVSLTIGDAAPARVVAVRVLFGSAASPQVYELPAGRSSRGRRSASNSCSTSR